MNPLEIEVKFYLPEPAVMRNRILSLGAESKGRFFEINFRYEDNEKNLIKKKSLLRLRKDSKTTLTFKSEPIEKKEDFKILHELEVEVNDFQTMNSILEALGFHKEQVYEKWRETLVLENTIFCIDTMPFGNFLEIEGIAPGIKKSAALLDLQWENRILLNYLSIYEKIQKKFHLPFSDITFENFKAVDLKSDSFFHCLQAF
jgi:adenylate cyclase class 2